VPAHPGGESDSDEEEPEQEEEEQSKKRKIDEAMIPVQKKAKKGEDDGVDTDDEMGATEEKPDGDSD
jgi:hypothetical protein